MVTIITSYLCSLSFKENRRINSDWRENKDRHRKMPDAFTVAIYIVNSVFLLIVKEEFPVFAGSLSVFLLIVPDELSRVRVADRFTNILKL